MSSDLRWGPRGSRSTPRHAHVTAGPGIVAPLGPRCTHLLDVNLAQGWGEVPTR